MQSNNIFLKVLTPYFIAVLKVEKENTKHKNYYILEYTGQNTFFYLNNLKFYFKESKLSRICDQYFTKINEKIKNKVLQKYPNLKDLFQEHYWRKHKILKLFHAQVSQNLTLNDLNQPIFSNTLPIRHLLVYILFLVF